MFARGSLSSSLVELRRQERPDLGLSPGSRVDLDLSSGSAGDPRPLDSKASGEL